jgi:7-cyano-7-deazaguanine synthase
MKKTVISLSGGIDSTTVLAMELERRPGREVHCISFKYPSKHNHKERDAAFKVFDYYAAEHDITFVPVDVTNMFRCFDSDLLNTGGPIPEGHYTDENQKRTVVPGRNTIFASFMLGYAQSIGADTIMLGIHAGDHAIYPDCRSDWFYAMNKVVDKSSEGRVFMIAPLLKLSKASVVRDGLFLNAPYHLTWTCYKGELTPCGVCGSCIERREAFELNGAKDPAWK